MTLGTQPEQPVPAGLAAHSAHSADSAQSALPLLLLAHSATTTHATWQPQIEALAGRFRVLAPDLPGYGGGPGPFTVERAVGQLAAVMGEESGVHVCGLSAGAVVALRLAVAYPAQIGSLVLSGLPLHTARLAAAVRTSLLAIMPAAAIGTRAGGPTKEAVRTAIREIGRTDLRPDLARVTARTLVVCGSRDTAHLPAARQAASGIAGAELRIIDGAGHLWNTEQPELFASTVAGWALAPGAARRDGAGRLPPATAIH